MRILSASSSMAFLAEPFVLTSVLTTFLLVYFLGAGKGSLGLFALAILPFLAHFVDRGIQLLTLREPPGILREDGGADDAQLFFLPDGKPARVKVNTEGLVAFGSNGLFGRRTLTFIPWSRVDYLGYEERGFPRVRGVVRLHIGASVLQLEGGVGATMKLFARCSEVHVGHSPLARS